MANVDLTQGGTTGHASRRNVRDVYVVENVIDWAKAVTAKGSALAAADTFDVINVPAETLVVGGGAEVLVVGDATAATVDIGAVGTDTMVDAGNIIASTGYLAAGTNGNIALALGDRPTAADTVRVTLATLTGTLATGKLRVYAVMCDVSGFNEK